jgi:hypothetical protein
MAPKTKVEQAIEKQNTKLNDALELQKENIKVIAEEYGLREDIAKVIAGTDRMEKSKLEVIKDIVDKTKDVLDNSKKIAEETLTTVDLHKLEREAIAEGLHDRVEIIQKMKSIQQIQKETNRIVNVQANMFKSIGSSIDDMIKSIPLIGNTLSDVLGVTDITENMAQEFRTVFQDAFDSKNLMRDIFVENSDEIIKGAGGLFGKGATKGISSALGSAAVLASLVGLVRFGFSGGLESMGFGAKFKKLIFGSTFDAFKDAFGNLNNASFTKLFRAKVLGVRFGVEQTDVAKILRAQTEISGLSQGQALDIQSSIATLAGRRGVLAKDVFADIAQNTELFANFAKDGGLNIGRAAVQAKELGLSLDTVGKVAENVLDFQSSIESELQASLLIGRQLNLNRARELSLAGDLEGLQKEIVKLVGSEAEFNQLNVIQRKKFAQALGVTTTELSKLVSGEVQLKSNDTKDNTDAVRELTMVMMIAAGFQAGKVARNVGGMFQTQFDKRAASFTPRESKNFAKTGRYSIPGVRGFHTTDLAKAEAKAATMARAGGGARLLAGGARFIPYVGAIITALSFLPMIFSLAKRFTGKSEEQMRKQDIASKLNFPVFSSELMSTPKES